MLSRTECYICHREFAVPPEPGEFPLCDDCDRWSMNKETKKAFSTLDTGAKKDTSGKLPLDLITLEEMEALAAARQAGLDKGYEKHNWKKGIPLSLSCAAALRHLFRFMAGTDIDAETGVSHLELAFNNLGFAVYNYRQHKDKIDDRFLDKEE